jgi:hypothetical protein
MPGALAAVSDIALPMAALANTRIAGEEAIRDWLQRSVLLLVVLAGVNP